MKRVPAHVEDDPVKFEATRDPADIVASFQYQGVVAKRQGSAKSCRTGSKNQDTRLAPFVLASAKNALYGVLTAVNNLCLLITWFGVPDQRESAAEWPGVFPLGRFQDTDVQSSQPAIERDGAGAAR